MAQIGYFPGQPIPRPLKPGRPVPPQVYDFDVISKWIEQTFRDIDFGRLPNFVKEDIVRDVKRQLEVSAEPKKETYDVQRALEYGEINETPGVQLQVNLNPEDWAKDPGKELDKVVGKVKKSIWNWDDVRNWAEKKYFWEPVVRGSADLSPAGSSSSLGFAEEMAKKLMGMDPAKPIQPYQMTDMEVWKTGPKGEQIVAGGGVPTPPTGAFVPRMHDVYQDAGESFLKFAGNADQAGTRNSFMHGFRVKALEAVAEELGQTMGAVSPVSQDAITNFGAGYNVLHVMHSVRSGPTNKSGLAMASTNLASISLEGVGSRSTVGRQVGAADIKGDPLTVQSTLTKLWDRTGDPTKLYKDRSVIGKALQDLGDARGTLGVAEQVRFDAATTAFRKKITGIQQLVESNLAKGNAIENKAAAALIKGRIDSLQKDLLDSNVFAKGIEFKFGEFMQNSFTNGRDPFGNNSLGTAMKEVADYRRSAGQKSGLENTKRLLTAANPIYDRNDFGDALQNFQDGKLMQRYAWPRMRTYVESLTPAVWVKNNIMAPTYSFGLKYDPDQAIVKAHKAGQYFDEVNDYKYIASLDKAARWCPVNTFKLKDIDGVGTIKLTGGKHFEGAINYHKLLTSKDGLLPAAYIKRLNATLDSEGNLIGFSDHGAAFLNFLNHREMSVVKALIPAGDANDLTKWMGQSERFKAWLFINQKKLGLKFDAAGNLIEGGLEGQYNAKVLASLIQKLGARMKSNDYISVLWERAGRLQILSSYANQLQTKILKSVGKYVAPFLQLKNAISTAVAEIVSKLLSQGLAAVTSGAAEFLAPLIDKIVKPIIKFVTNLVITKVQNFADAVIHGDFSGFLKDQEKLIAAATKSCLFFFGIPMLVIFFIAFAFFGTTLTTMPVVDPTRGSGFVMTGGGSVPSGDPIYCEGPLSEDDGDLAALSGAINGIAQRGFELLQGHNTEPGRFGLTRGFGCRWNHHLDYPQFWNAALYEENPSGDGLDQWDAMYWCTYLVLQSYTETGKLVAADWGRHAGVRNMAMLFGSDGTLNSPSGISTEGTYAGRFLYIANTPEGIRAHGIRSGDAVFFKIGEGDFAHVALVYSVNDDVVETIHSNASLKRYSFPRDADTGVVQDAQFFNVVGFGRVN